MPDVVEPPAPGAAAALPLSAAQNVQQAILRWYAGHARDLPWRRPDASPWSVLVSEFMLQQTPVARVLPAHEAWLRRWPTPAALAASSPGDAIRQWGRLGYPRRAVRLHACARIIAAEHDGQVPDRLDALLALPGVGQYTAAAASFAFGQRHPVLDTNVRRVLARLLAGRAFPSRAGSVAEVALARSLLPAEPRLAARWSVAVMELGALVCTAARPGCDQCPVGRHCSWHGAGHPLGMPAGARAGGAGPRQRPPAQRYEGTDRQCRGALLAVLRNASGPVPAADLEAAWPDPDQCRRALQSLLTDGLAAEPVPGRFTLPG